MRDPVFDGINPEDLEEPIPESKWKKPFFITIGFFLLVLIFSLSFSDFLLSFFNSRSVDDEVLYFPNATFIFENNVFDSLKQEYVSHEDREIKACLFGRIDGSLYYIDKIEFPEIIRANVFHVVSVPCPVDVLVDLHGHPINSCIPSEQDLSVLREYHKSDPLLRMLIMCSSSRFVLIS